MIFNASWYHKGASLNVHADTIGELQSALAAFPPTVSNYATGPETTEPVVVSQWVDLANPAAVGEELEAEVQDEVQDEQPVRRRPRRKRRETVEAPIVEEPVAIRREHPEPPVLTKLEPFPEPVLPEATAPKAASAQDLTESFAAPAASKDVVAATQAKKAALSDVSAALLDASARGVGLDALRGLIQQVGGVERVSDVAPEKWSALIAAFKGATA